MMESGVGFLFASKKKDVKAKETAYRLRKKYEVYNSDSARFIVYTILICLLVCIIVVQSWFFDTYSTVDFFVGSFPYMYEKEDG